MDPVPVAEAMGKSASRNFFSFALAATGLPSVAH
jgi:hypothetical protein